MLTSHTKTLNITDQSFPTAYNVNKDNLVASNQIGVHLGINDKLDFSLQHTSQNRSIQSSPFLFLLCFIENIKSYIECDLVRRVGSGLGTRKL